MSKATQNASFAAQTYPTRSLGGAASAGAIQVIRFPIGLVTTQSVTVLPAGAIVLEADLDVRVAYTGPTGATGPTQISIGQIGTPSEFMPTVGNTPSIVGIYQALQDTPAVSTNPVLATITGGPPITGSGFVIVRYVDPPQP